MYIETERLIIRSTELSDAKSFIEMASDGSLDEDIFCGCSRDYAQWIRGCIRIMGMRERNFTISMK